MFKKKRPEKSCRAKFRLGLNLWIKHCKTSTYGRVDELPKGVYTGPPADPAGRNRDRQVTAMSPPLYVRRQPAPMPPQEIPMEKVTLVTELPRDVAEKVKAAQSQDPELVRRILTFGLSQKVIYDTLVANSWGL